MDLKKIADEIAEKCGVDRVYVNLDISAWAQFESDDHERLTVKINDDHYTRKCLPVQGEISEAAHHVADEWIATKGEREKAELEAARALIAKHEGGSDDNA